MSRHLSNQKKNYDDFYQSLLDLMNDINTRVPAEELVRALRLGVGQHIIDYLKSISDLEKRYNALHYLVFEKAVLLEENYIALIPIIWQCIVLKIS